jgi:hypothetical protein
MNKCAKSEKKIFFLNKVVLKKKGSRQYFILNNFYLNLTSLHTFYVLFSKGNFFVIYLFLQPCRVICLSIGSIIRSKKNYTFEVQKGENKRSGHKHGFEAQNQYGRIFIDQKYYINELYKMNM